MSVGVQTGHGCHSTKKVAVELIVASDRTKLLLVTILKMAKRHLPGRV